MALTIECGHEFAKVGDDISVARSFPARKCFGRNRVNSDVASIPQYSRPAGTGHTLSGREAAQYRARIHRLRFKESWFLASAASIKKGALRCQTVWELSSGKKVGVGHQFELAFIMSLKEYLARVRFEVQEFLTRRRQG